MNEFKAINLDNGVILIHPLRETDMGRYDILVNDLFEIFGDIESTKFIPEKRVIDSKQISDRLFGVVSRYHRNESYTHFITLKKINKTIGQVDIISPKLVQQEYGIKNTWFIEFFLSKQFWGKGIMTGVISAIINNLRKQGINNIAALCLADNIRSAKLLKKVGFRCIRQIEGQDLYVL